MRQIAFLFVALMAGTAQGQPAKSFVGTVSALKAETAEIEIKPDNAAPVALKIGSGTIAQKIAPGEKDLKKAEAIQIAEVAVGDRVLVTPEPGTTDLRRIIVMAATDIAKRNEADRLDWTRRGVSGVVAAKNASEITLKMRTMTGAKQAVVTVGEKTTFKRYAPDSVKFADAMGSKLAEVNVGDQLRARGQKSEDGLKVTADDVVFGTFLTKAGSVTAVNLTTKEVTVKDLTNNKPVVVRFTADSQLKKMPDLSAMMGGMPGGGMAGRGAGSASATAPAPGGMMRPGGGGGMDIAQMLERMPAGKLEDLKPGDTIIVSSTKGAKADEITAIMFLSNAGMLIQMASMQQGGGRAGAGGSGMPGGAGMGGMGGAGMDLGGMGLGGIIP
jgi:co-chaperonin GroES (HSP10)